MVKHVPVLLDETLDYLNCTSGLVYMDCTLGGAGHTQAILEHLDGTGKLIAIDSDHNAILQAQTVVQKHKNVLTVVQDNFKNIKNILEACHVPSVTGGILADLGISMDQLKDSSKGLSFMMDCPLDMRIDSTTSLTAYKIVNEYPQKELIQILQEIGEERNARKIVQAILQKRQSKAIESTTELREIIRQAVRGSKYSKIDPATKTFMALRIVVNQELENLEKLLGDALDVMEVGARLVLITFHSLEDRIVKHFFMRCAKGCTCPPHYPECICGNIKRLKILTKKPVVPTVIEIKNNRAARSAKLRAAEKVA